MDRLKENKGGVIAIAASALAIGYLVYSQVKGKDAAIEDDQTTVDAREQTEEERVIPNAFFMSETLSKEQQKKEIDEWVRDQVAVLLSENEDSKLTVSGGKLGEKDFHRVLHILLSYQAVLSQELRTKQAAQRSQIIKEQGIDSTDYLEKLIMDCQAVIDEESTGLETVLGFLDLRDDIVASSQEAYIGQVQEKQAGYIRDFLELYQNHPYRATTKKGDADALQIVKSVLAKACERFGKKDVQGSMGSEEEYMFVFHVCCLDIARENHQLSQADFLCILDENDLSRNAALQTYYDDLSSKLLKELDAEPEAEEQEDEEALEKEAAARKIEREETIKRFLTAQLEEKNKTAPKENEEQKKPAESATPQQPVPEQTAEQVAASQPQPRQAASPTRPTRKSPDISMETQETDQTIIATPRIADGTETDLPKTVNI